MLTAFKAIRVGRLKTFLRGLESAAGDLPLEDRRTFAGYVDSELGRELLGDFAEQVVRTRSKTALAALAILYAHPQADNERKARTALGLEGISENSIDAFLLMTQSRGALQREGRPVAELSNEVVDNDSSLRSFGWSGDGWVAEVDDLMARGLLGRDLSASGRIGKEGVEWNRYFHFTSESEWYRELLSRAREHLDAQNVLGL